MAKKNANSHFKLDRLTEHFISIFKFQIHSMLSKLNNVHAIQYKKGTIKRLSNPIADVKHSEKVNKLVNIPRVRNFQSFQTPKTKEVI